MKIQLRIFIDSIEMEKKKKKKKRKEKKCS